jgi:hypothetical protein
VELKEPAKDQNFDEKLCRFSARKKLENCCIKNKEFSENSSFCGFQKNYVISGRVF